MGIGLFFERNGAVVLDIPRIHSFSFFEGRKKGGVVCRKRPFRFVRCVLSEFRVSELRAARSCFKSARMFVAHKTSTLHPLSQKIMIFHKLPSYANREDCLLDSLKENRFSSPSLSYCRDPALPQIGLSVGFSLSCARRHFNGLWGTNEPRGQSKKQTSSSASTPTERLCCAFCRRVIVRYGASRGSGRRG